MLVVFVAWSCFSLAASSLFFSFSLERRSERQRAEVSVKCICFVYINTHIHTQISVYMYINVYSHVGCMVAYHCSMIFVTYMPKIDPILTQNWHQNWHQMEPAWHKLYTKLTKKYTQDCYNFYIRLTGQRGQHQNVLGVVCFLFRGMLLLFLCCFFFVLRFFSWAPERAPASGGQC